MKDGIRALTVCLHCVCGSNEQYISCSVGCEVKKHSQTVQQNSITGCYLGGGGGGGGGGIAVLSRKDESTGHLTSR